MCQEDLPFDLHLLPSQVPRTLESRTLEGFICHMAARSRGRMWITSRDPNAAPRIATNYLTDEGGRDTTALIYATQAFPQGGTGGADVLAYRERAVNLGEASRPTRR